jgi:ubiquinol-cytochrome c reductase iron-sulfur subunit
MQGKDQIDQARRTFLLRATGFLAASGAVFAAIPFLRALWPSLAAQDAGKPVTVDVGKMDPGEQLTVIWRGKPIWIIRRRPEAIALLAKLNKQLRDPYSRLPQQPGYIHGVTRSLRPEFLVLVGVCTHLGCAPTYRPTPGSLDRKWPGGFFCSCHGSRFDLAGRVFKGVPAPTNLEVPPYVFKNDHTIIIGQEKL